MTLSYNETMAYIMLGAFGFALAYAFDWASLKQLAVIKQLIGLAAVFLLVFATTMVCLTPEKLNLPFFTLPLGGCLLVISLCLLVYSLFIEIPFQNTYAKQGVGDELITSGTYALVRHPGVIWLAFVYLSLALLFPSTTLFIAVAIWMILDIIHVTLQERLFPRMFPDYPAYQQQTPFLVPNRQSLSTCLKTIKLRAKQRG